MCGFLLRNGADVDHVAPIVGLMDLTTALGSPINDFECDEITIRLALECRKLLLLAGCDPTWAESGAPDGWKSPIQEAFQHGVPVSKRLQREDSSKY